MQDVSHAQHALKELQSQSSAVVAGAGTATNIPLAGATVAKTTIQSVIMYAAGVPSDVTSEASITSDGNMQLDTTDSTGNQLVVQMWNDVGL